MRRGVRIGVAVVLVSAVLIVLVVMGGWLFLRAVSVLACLACCTMSHYVDCVLPLVLPSPPLLAPPTLTLLPMVVFAMRLAVTWH